LRQAKCSACLPRQQTTETETQTGIWNKFRQRQPKVAPSNIVSIRSAFKIRGGIKIAWLNSWN